MENPIKENRLVCSYTFAVRLRSLMERIAPYAASMEEEKEVFTRWATELLNYQVATAKDLDELVYLKSVGELRKAPILTSYEGVEVYNDKLLLFSCMKEPRVGEQILTYTTSRYSHGTINTNRLFFVHKKNCEEYIEENRPRYSKADLKRIIKNKERGKL